MYYTSKKSWLICKVKSYVFLIFLASLSIFCACASSYKIINPPGLNYVGKSDVHDIVTFKLYDVLSRSGNRGYAKREIKKNVNIVAVQVINNSSDTLEFFNDLELYVNGQIEAPLPPNTVVAEIGQVVPLYLLYGLLVFYTETCENFECDRTNYPIGLPIAAGNMIVAGSSNGKLRKELKLYDLSGKVIYPGDKVYGLVGLNYGRSGTLEFRRRVVN